MAEAQTLEATGDEYGSMVEHVTARSLPKKKVLRHALKIDGSGAAAAAIRNAFARGRGGHTETTKGTTRGRCDNGSLYRIAAGDNRLFHRRSSPSPDNWLVWVMVDWSGSMSHRCNETLSTARALASASRSVPTMRMAIKTWTGPQSSRIANAGVVDLWETGQSVEALQDAERIEMGGTPDATAMAWAARAIRREARGSERTMIVFLSDGEGMSNLGDVVEAARKAGTEVVSVALDNLSTQQAVYGERRAVPWTGSITRSAGPLARMLVQVMK
jgi:Mg-chelatase subunit ChlD